MSLFSTEPKFDFIGRRWYAIGVSTLIIVAGIAMVASRGGLPLGIDFSGGTLVVLEFAQPTSEDVIRSSLASVMEKVVQQYGDSGGGILVRLPQAGPEEGMSLEEGAQAIVSTLQASDLGDFEVVSRELVGPVIGEELQQRGINAFVWAMIRHLGLRWLTFSIQLWCRRDCRRGPRHLGHPLDADVFWLRGVAQRGRRDADDHWIFGQ